MKAVEDAEAAAEPKRSADAAKNAAQRAEKDATRVSGNDRGTGGFDRGSLAAFGFIAALIAIGLILATYSMHEYGLLSHETVLPLLLVSGVVLLIATLGAFVTLLHAFRLTDQKQALGMPEGSIRAVLAIALVLVFAIMAVYLFSEIQAPQTLVSKGLTAEQVQLLPQDQIVQVVPVPDSSPQLSDVTLERNNAGATQIAQQIVTVLATLVTAVAAFYFGASTVKDARAAADRSAPGAGTGA